MSLFNYIFLEGYCLADKEEKDKCPKHDYNPDASCLIMDEDVYKCEHFAWRKVDNNLREHSMFCRLIDIWIADDDELPDADKILKGIMKKVYNNIKLGYFSQLVNDDQSVIGH